MSKAARRGRLTVFVATGEGGELLGSIDFIDDMRHYGSGGTASTVTDAAGVGLLAVDAAYRGKGAGKALARFCIERARPRQDPGGVAYHQGDADGLGNV